MSLFKSKEERTAAREAAKVKRDTRIAQLKAKQEAIREDAWGPRPVKRTDLDAEEFTVFVRENIATAGFGTSSLMKYRFEIRYADRIVKVGYEFTMMGAQRMADKWVADAVAGKKKIAA